MILKFATVRSLLAIGCVYAAAWPLANEAEGYTYSQFYRQRLNPISREGFFWVNHLGGGMNQHGYYRNPVSTVDAFGGTLPNGWNYAPMAWDDQGTAALYFVQGGYIIQQDFKWNRGVQ